MSRSVTSIDYRTPAHPSHQPSYTGITPMTGFRLCYMCGLGSGSPGWTAECSRAFAIYRPGVPFAQLAREETAS